MCAVQMPWNRMVSFLYAASSGCRGAGSETEERHREAGIDLLSIARASSEGVLPPVNIIFDWMRFYRLGITSVSYLMFILLFFAIRSTTEFCPSYIHSVHTVYITYWTSLRWSLLSLQSFTQHGNRPDLSRWNEHKLSPKVMSLIHIAYFVRVVDHNGQCF